MWIILIFAFLSLWLLLINLASIRDWRISFIYATIVFQAYLAAITELLSLFQAVTQWGIFLAWLALFLVCGVWLWRLWRRDHRLVLPEFSWPERVSAWIVNGIIVFILLVTLIIAVAGPPNTADTLVNDMPRVAYWAQAGNVKHFAASSETFNSHMPGAEFQMLHLYVLYGGDRLVTLQGWMSFLGAIIAVSALSQELGVSKVGQRFSALFVATMPVAITHASSAKNDLLLAFWVIIVILMAFRFLRQEQKKSDLFLLGCAIGLAVLTKESAAIFLAPFALWFIYKVLTKFGWRKLLLVGLWVVVVVGALTSGSLIRNVKTYHGLSDPTAISHFKNEAFSLPILASTVVRNISLHAQTPYPWSRTWIYDRIIDFHDWLGVDPSDRRITVESDFEVPGFITSEVVSGNPLHMALILAALVIFWVSSFWKHPPKDLLVLSICAGLAYILFSAVFKWQIFGARYQFPILFMAAPVPAYLVGRIDRKGWLSAFLGVVMLGLASLWLFCLGPRPIFTWEGMTQDVSVFEDRNRLYFPSEDSYHYFMEMADVVEESGCQEVGLHVRGSSMSYLYWFVLGKPQTELRIEYLVAGTPSARYADLDFSPCAVICEDCSAEQTTYDQLSLYKTYNYFKLYINFQEP